MKRLTVLCVLVGLAVSASAQVNVGQGVSVEFAHGDGVLTSRDNTEARFAFRVRQRGDAQAEGTLKFVAPGPHGSTVTISTERLPRLEVNGDRASFGGPAVLEVSGRDGFRWEGQVVVHIRNDVRLTDRRDGRVVDLMEIAFPTDRTDRRYDFAGWTQPRNIDVGIRTGDR